MSPFPRGCPSPHDPRPQNVGPTKKMKGRSLFFAHQERLLWQKLRGGCLPPFLPYSHVLRTIPPQPSRSFLVKQQAFLESLLRHLRNVHARTTQPPHQSGRGEVENIWKHLCKEPSGEREWREYNELVMLMIEES